jgi:hypothetical protein
MDDCANDTISPCQCGSPLSRIVSIEGSSVCPDCGLVDTSDLPLIPTFEAPVKRSHPGRPDAFRNPDGISVNLRAPTSGDADEEEEVLSEGVSFGHMLSSNQFFSSESKGRYKPVFHWNERIAQMSLTDPPLPDNILAEITEEADSGEYEDRSTFSRATVTVILKKLELQKYRERWKSILHHLNPSLQMIYPHPNFLARVEPVYNMMEYLFFVCKHSMPKSVIRGKNGLKIKERHNIIPFNYLFRKIMEHFDCWDFHEELPLLRSATKLQHLDDITETIAAKIGLKFSRTPIIKAPKIKKRRI